MLTFNARILTCPHCGGEKEVVSVATGNTFGATLWSDIKQIAPMFPRVSPVQKCPTCGHYYLLSRQSTEHKYGTEESSNTGDLSFEEMKEALQESATWQLTAEEENCMRVLIVWAYNDKYYRSNEKGTENIIIPTEDEEYFKENVLALIPIYGKDDYFKAELYREIGLFEDAIKILKSIETKDDFIKKFIADMTLKAEQGDKKVWKVY